MRKLPLALGVVLGLVLTIPPATAKSAVRGASGKDSAGKASDELVLKCRAGVFRKYGRRTPDGKYLALRDYDAVRLVDFCLSNGGKVL